MVVALISRSPTSATAGLWCWCPAGLWCPLPLLTPACAMVSHGQNPSIAVCIAQLRGIGALQVPVPSSVQEHIPLNRPQGPGLLQVDSCPSSTGPEWRNGTGPAEVLRKPSRR